MKRKSGIKSMIAFRRGRAKVAAKVARTKDVAALLGHKPNSRSTRRYTARLDVRELEARRKMTRVDR